MTMRGAMSMRNEMSVRSRFGLSTTVVVLAVLCTVIAGVIFATMRGGDEYETTNKVVDVHTVKRGDFKIKMPSQTESTAQAGLTR